MIKSRTALVLLAGAALLAACNKGAPGGNGAAAGASSQVAASGPDIEITADQLPHPRAGEWEVIETNNRVGRSITDKHCYSGKPIDPKEMAKNCQTFVLKKTFLGVYTIDASCKNPDGMTMSMHFDMHGDFTGGWVSDGVASITIPNRAPMTVSSHTEAHYLGPCTPGETPEN